MNMTSIEEKLMENENIMEVLLVKKDVISFLVLTESGDSEEHTYTGLALEKLIENHYMILGDVSAPEELLGISVCEIIPISEYCPDCGMELIDDLCSNC